ncbi:MAG: hypothetical protein M1834_000642 [Cirrosporium novae-zelandiae]|nr:MAG: hypothetical protein M1834_000642 [Cirrosporium novae-zelandiae]
MSDNIQAEIIDSLIKLQGCQASDLGDSRWATRTKETLIQSEPFDHTHTMVYSDEDFLAAMRAGKCRGSNNYKSRDGSQNSPQPIIPTPTADPEPTPETIAKPESAVTEARAATPIEATTPGTNFPALVSQALEDAAIQQQFKQQLSVPSSPSKPRAPEPKSVETKEDRENKLSFDSWPSPKGRLTAPAEIRKVFLEIPENSTPTFIQSAVFFGKLESVRVVPRKNPDSPSTLAEVIFVSPEACKKYSDATANGVKVKDHVIYVQSQTDVTPISGQLQEMLQKGATRCLRIIGVDSSYSVPVIYKLVEKWNVEKMMDMIIGGLGRRVLTIRFTTIQNAYLAKSTLATHDDFESCNIQFAMDPCEFHTGVHIEL